MRLGLAAIAIAIFIGIALFFMFREHRRIKQGTDLYGPAMTTQPTVEAQALYFSERLGDFRHFFWAAQAMRTGGDPYAAGHFGERPGYIYPPLIAFLYMPLSRYDIHTAANIIEVINVILLFSAVWILAAATVRTLRPEGAPTDLLAVALVALGSAILAFDKIKGELQMLQTNATILIAWVVGLWALERRRDFFAGLGFGVAFNVKYQVIGLFPYLLVRRRWTVLAFMILAIIAVALLPSVYVGFSADLEYLKHAFGGVLRLVGINIGGEVADVEPMWSGFNISIPAGIIRMQMAYHWFTFAGPMTIAGMIAIAWLAGVVVMYVVAGVRPFGRISPFLVGAELVVLMGVTLAFSPQTNSRHTLLTVGIDAVGLAMILLGRMSRGKKIIVFIGLLIMLAGLTLPPSQREGNDTASFQSWWWYGGPTWCVLAGATFILWGALQEARVNPLAGGEKAALRISPAAPLPV